MAMTTHRSPQLSPPRARARAFSCGRATTTELGRCSGGGGGAAAWRQRSAMRHMGGGVVLETPHTRAAALRRSSAGALTFSVERDQKIHRQEGRDGRDGISATTGSGAPCAPRATTFPVMPSPRRNFARLVA